PKERSVAFQTLRWNLAHAQPGRRGKTACLSVGRGVAWACALAPRRRTPARPAGPGVRMAVRLLRARQQSQRARPGLRGARAERAAHLGHRPTGAGPGLLRRRRTGSRVGIRQRQGAFLRSARRAAPALYGPPLRRESARGLVDRRAGAGGTAALRTGEEDGGGLRAPLDLRDRAVDRLLDPPAPVDARLRRPGTGRAAEHARGLPRIAFPDVRADVRRTPDGGPRPGSRVPLGVLARLPPLLAGILLCAGRRARVSVRASGRH